MAQIYVIFTEINSAVLFERNLSVFSLLLDASKTFDRNNPVHHFFN